MQKEIKNIQMEGRNKNDLFMDDMIFHTESSLKITHTFTQMHTTARTSTLILQKAEGYKINTQNTVVLLYANNEQSKRKASKQFN